MRSFNKNKKHGARVCYHYGDTSHMISECTLVKILRDLTMFALEVKSGPKKDNSLNCLPSFL